MGRRRSNTEARNLWVKHHGPIGKDPDGFTLEIHHRDGDSTNNNIDNLMLVTIREHLELHKNRGDWGAVALIAKRLGKGPGYMSEIQRGVKRPGVGGVARGSVPWNKGLKGCFSKDVVEKMSVTRRGRRFGKLKISDAQASDILQMYNSKPDLPNVGERSRNGRVLSYETVFCKSLCQEYGVTSAQIRNIITGKRNVCT